MKRFVVIIFILGIASFFVFNSVKNKVKEDLAKPVELPSVRPVDTEAKDQDVVTSLRSIFIPYWSLEDKADYTGYDKLMYFGITPLGNKINRQEDGYRAMSDFLDSVPSDKDKYLVIRMLDSDTTFPILKDSIKQEILTDDAISIAVENGFDGIVLDLEIAAVPFDSLIKQVDEFTSLFYKNARDKNLQFTIIFYGDTFYRLRPFDVKSLSKNADDFLIMAYDFHKSRSNPGPNFPLRGKEVYGYDMTRMTSDFLKFIPAGKVGVVFGMFGYDWEVDENGNASGMGEALTYKQIRDKFLDGCEFVECSIKRKNDSRETEIQYTDEMGSDHIVWFEDMESVTEKQNYLKEKGIGSFSFWAYSYF